MTNELRPGAKRTRTFLENSRVAQYALRIIGVFGVSLVMSDGVLTPAQSVLGAIQGLQIVKPDITSATIIGTSCAIIVLLFLIQPFGTTKIASSFAPIVMIWLLFNLAFGIYVSPSSKLDRCMLTSHRILLYTTHPFSRRFLHTSLAPTLSETRPMAGNHSAASFLHSLESKLFSQTWAPLLVELCSSHGSALPSRASLSHISDKQPISRTTPALGRILSSHLYHQGPFGQA